MSAKASEIGSIIRLMTADDIEQVMQIELDAYPFPWTEGIFKDCLRVGYPAWVYEKDTQLVAYAVASVAVGEAHLLNICVRRDLQGSGIGRVLLDAVFDGCVRLGAQVMFLEVRVSNIRAKNLYLHTGFREIGLRKEYYPSADGREDAMVLSRLL